MSWGTSPVMEGVIAKQQREGVLFEDLKPGDEFRVTGGFWSTGTQLKSYITHHGVLREDGEVEMVHPPDGFKSLTYCFQFNPKLRVLLISSKLGG